MEETESKLGRQLTVVPAARAPRISAAVAAAIVVPAIVADAGDRAAKRFLEFFAATIRNKNTRMSDQAKPTLESLKKAAEHHMVVLHAQKEFQGLVEGQLEVVGPHLQLLNAIYHKHQQIHGTVGAS